MSGINKLAQMKVVKSGNTKDVKKEMSKMDAAIKEAQPKPTTKPQ